VKAVCGGANVTIKFSPIEPFNGMVFVGSDLDNTSCSLIKKAGDSFYSGVFNHSKQCGSYWDIHPLYRYETFKSVLQIHYNDVFFDDNDLHINISCQYTDNVTSTAIIRQIRGSVQSIKIIDEIYKPACAMSVRTNPGMEELSGPVRLGQRVFLFNYLADDTFFKTLHVDKCTVTDKINNISETIIMSGCPTKKAKNVFFGDAVKVPKPGIVHDIKIFKLHQNTTNLIFTCHLSLCRDPEDKACAVTNCSHSQFDDGSLFRKKRHVSPSNIGSKDKTITEITITISDDLPVDVRDSSHYHCGRYGQSCKHGGICDPTSGECQCPGNFLGYACQENITGWTADSFCSLKCKNGGTCYKDKDSKEKCLCTENYIGDACEDSRVNIECGHNNVSLQFTPIEPFNGLVYVRNDQGQKPYRLVQLPGDDFYSGVFSKELESKKVPEINSSNGDNILKKVLNIYFNDIFLDDLDMSLNVTCLHTDDPLTEREVGQIGESGETGDEMEQNDEPARLSIRTNPDMAEITDAVSFGQRVFLFNYLEDDKFFKRLYVDRCTATDVIHRRSITIVESGCPTEKAQRIFYSDAMRTSKPGITHDIKMFKLHRDTTKLTFTCYVTLCRDPSESVCELATCSTKRHLNRHDRSVWPLGGKRISSKDQITETTITIRDPLPVDTPDTPLLTHNNRAYKGRV
jgi:hypothetical protein